MEHSQNIIPETLRQLLATTDHAAFEKALDELVQKREKTLFRALGLITRELHETVKHLAVEIHADSLAEGGILAQRQLSEVLSLSEQAANRHLDLSESLLSETAELEKNANAFLQQYSGRVNDSTESDPLLGDAVNLAQHVHRLTDACRKNLKDMIVAQSFQDMTGLHVRQASAFVHRVEAVLIELLGVTGSLVGIAFTPSTDTPAERVATQSEVDRLLSEFGF